MELAHFFTGTAGWAIGPEHRGHFAEGASLLARYATRFRAVEVNSSFHRPHRPQTYERWAASVPEDFRFSVKAPKTITHDAKLCGADRALQGFLEDIAGLGSKLGPLLFQLPPKLGFDAGEAQAFFAGLRVRYGGAVVCEPRHPDWFAKDADCLLKEFRIARAAADPARCPGGNRPGGWRGFVYYRLHGSPRMYYEKYASPALTILARELIAAQRDAWCIFDNTALGHATANALEILEQTAGSRVLS